MSVISAFIFLFCLWAVFSRYFQDGIITKHFFAFSAITAALVVMDPVNVFAFLTSLLLLISGISYWLTGWGNHGS